MDKLLAVSVMGVAGYFIWVEYEKRQPIIAKKSDAQINADKQIKSFLHHKKPINPIFIPHEAKVLNAFQIPNLPKPSLVKPFTFKILF